jgi:hypothetical protein
MWAWLSWFRILVGLVVVLLTSTIGYFGSQNHDLQVQLDQTKAALDDCQTAVAAQVTAHEQALDYINRQCNGLEAYYRRMPPPPDGNHSYLPDELRNLEIRTPGRKDFSGSENPPPPETPRESHNSSK